MKVHVGGNIFECSDYASAARLAAWFHETLFGRLPCATCQREIEIPIKTIENCPIQRICADCYISLIAALPIPRR